jgi:hypothetical protein
MESRSASIVAGLMRSMQYMDARSGGLRVDFGPIRSYVEIAPGEDHYERVRTVLDWISFAAELGLLPAADWTRAFEQPADLCRFAAELRRYDLPMQAHHRHAFARLGLLPPGVTAGYAQLADVIDAGSPRRAAA